MSYDDPNRQAVGLDPITSSTPTASGPFDPSEATVEDVLAYLEGNPGDRDRVLDLERSGKARVGILGHDEEELEE